MTLYSERIPERHRELPYARTAANRRRHIRSLVLGRRSKKGYPEQLLRARAYALISLPDDKPVVHPIITLDRTVAVSVAALGWSDWLKVPADAGHSIKGIAGLVTAVIAFLVGWYEQLLLEATYEKYPTGVMAPVPLPRWRRVWIPN